MRIFLRKLLTSLVATALVLYAGRVFIEQEKELRELELEKSNYRAMLDEAKMKTEELNEIKSKVNTDEYIEECAREKLGLVMPYEIIFVDASI